MNADAETDKGVVVKERPILFSGAMVRAILEGRKTQTRRVVKPQPDAKTQSMYPLETLDFSATTDKWVQGYIDARGREWTDGKDVRCPYGKPGDRLWVRDTWALEPTQYNFEKWVIYKADGMAHRCGMGEDEDVNYRPSNPELLADWTPRKWPGEIKQWKPSIFMPRWASRILLEVVSVRVERLREITEENAITEGIEQESIATHPSYPNDKTAFWKGYLNGGRAYLDSPIESYRSLWESINGPESWEVNPWVWVVEFKVLKPEQAEACTPNRATEPSRDCGDGTPTLKQLNR